MGPAPGTQGVPTRVVTCEYPKLMGERHREAGALTGHIWYLMSAWGISEEVLGLKMCNFSIQMLPLGVG